MSNQNTLNLKFKGIFTDPNNLSAVPTGALQIAENVDIDRDDIIETRRGYKQYGNELLSNAKQLLAYKDRLLVHYGSNLAYDNEKLEITSLTSTNSGSITNITTGATVTITSASHGLSDEDVIIIEGSNSTPSVNGRYVINYIDANSFEITPKAAVTSSGSAGTWYFNTTTARAVTASAHGLTTGQLVTITGSDYPEYNVRNAAITVINSTTFTYSLSNISTSPATGNIYLESGTFTNNAVSIDEPETGRKIQGKELNGNLYLTSSNGIKKLTSATATLNSAGMPKGLNTTLELVDSPGFLEADSQVAYRIVWGITDENNNLILGSPSQREVIICSGEELLIKSLNELLNKLDQDNGISSNDYAQQFSLASGASVEDIFTAMSGLGDQLDTDLAATIYGTGVNEIMEDALDTVDPITDLQERFDSITAALNIEGGSVDTDYDIVRSSQQVQLTVIIPAGITTNHFFQVYRSPISAGADVSPSDELQLCYEANPTSAEITAGEVVFTDITPEAFLGASLYSNANQEGIAQTNDVPPFAKDIAIFKNSMFYANTKTKHKLDLNLLGVANLTGIVKYLNSTDVTDILHQTGNTIRYTFAGTVDLSEVTTGHRLKSYYATNSANNGTFQITSVNNTSKYIEVTNPNRSNASLDEVGSPAKIAILGDTITIDGTEYFFRSSASEVSKVIHADKSAMSDTEYYKLSTPNNERTYAIWYNKSGSAAIPVLSNVIAIEIDISSGAIITGANVATATKAVLDTITSFTDDFTITQSTDTLTFTCNEVGNTTNLDTSFVTVGVGSGVVRDGYDGEDSNIDDLTITNISAASPTVITSAAHGLTTGDIINITGSNSTPSIDGQHVVEYLTANTFTIRANVSIAGSAGTASKIHCINLSSEISQGIAVDETAKSLVRVLNLDLDNTVVGYYTSGADDVPGKLRLEREDITDSEFTVSSTDAISFSPDLSSGVQSDNEEIGNRIYYSKASQPEAVPAINYLDVGSRELPIQRIVALRDSLFVFKKDGIYRITGEGTSSLQLSLFDSSAKLVSPESAVVGNNQVYVFTDQGIVSVSDTGINVISRAIEKDLLPFYGAALKDLVNNYSFGVFSETERKYMLWLPESESDTSATFAYVYNVFTQAWTTYPIAKTCGLVNPRDDKIYLGAAEDTFIERERKDFNYRDQADREIELTITNANVSDPVLITSISTGRPCTITTSSRHELEVGDYVLINETEGSPSSSVPNINGKYQVLRVPSPNKFVIKAPRVTVAGGAVGQVTKLSNAIEVVSTSNIEPGDVLIQSSSLNVNRFNALLSRLDTDAGIDSVDYYDSLKIVSKDELAQAIVDLADKLNDDLGTTSTYYAELQSSPKAIQDEFNKIVKVLNEDPSVSISNYSYSRGNFNKEVGIVAVDRSNNILTLAYAADLAADQCFIQKGIRAEVEWIPQHAGDASVNKQYSEAQFMFSDIGVSSIIAGFKTEISKFYEDIVVEGKGTGAWGLFPWGSRPFGLGETSEDIRTYVPTNKQRCRIISPRIIHSNAYESFSMNGLALIFRATGFRVNR